MIHSHTLALMLASPSNSNLGYQAESLGLLPQASSSRQLASRCHTASVMESNSQYQVTGRALQSTAATVLVTGRVLQSTAASAAASKLAGLEG